MTLIKQLIGQPQYTSWKRRAVNRRRPLKSSAEPKTFSERGGQRMLNPLDRIKRDLRKMCLNNHGAETRLSHMYTSSLLPRVQSLTNSSSDPLSPSRVPSLKNTPYVIPFPPRFSHEYTRYEYLTLPYPKPCPDRATLGQDS